FRRSAEVAPQTIPALPRHARVGDEPDPAESRNEDARPRQRRNATADDAAGAAARSGTAANADDVRAALTGWRPSRKLRQMYALSRLDYSARRFGCFHPTSAGVAASARSAPRRCADSRPGRTP